MLKSFGFRLNEESVEKLQEIADILNNSRKKPGKTITVNQVGRYAIYKFLENPMKDFDENPSLALNFNDILRIKDSAIRSFHDSQEITEFMQSTTKIIDKIQN